MLDDAVREIVGLVRRRALESNESLTNLVQEIDVEMYLKHPDMPDRSLSDEVYGRIVSLIPSAGTTDEVIMLTSAASYCVMGYMRRAPDIRYVRKRCIDASDMCAGSADVIREMPRGKRTAGKIKPKFALKYAEAFSGMFRKYADEIDAATAGMDAADLDRIRDAWTSFPDRYVQIREALTESYQLALADVTSRGRHTRRRDAAIQMYVADFIAGTDPLSPEDGDAGASETAVKENRKPEKD